MTSLIAKIINSRSEDYLKALRLDVPWSDAVSEQRRDDSDQPDPDTTSRNAFIYRRFGHLTVNPNKPGASKAITDSYVWSTDKRDGIVNRDEIAAQQFLKRLIAAAKHASRLHETPAAPDPAAEEHQATRMFVLHGERGMGKTFYLNYLLSRFWSVLDDERVVWVRLNLVANFGPSNNLSHWIAAQVSKVLIRYYDEHQNARQPGSSPPIPLDYISHLKSFVNEKFSDDPQRRGELIDKIVQMAEIFRDVRYEKPISDDLVPSVLGSEMMRYAREMGYSFIVVLDGLDRLDVTRSAKHKFDSLCRQVDLIGRAYESQGFALLVVSRTKTLKSTNSCFSDPYRQGSTRCMMLGPVDLSNIVNRRLEVIESEVWRIAETFHWDMGDWPAHILEFGIRLSQEMGDKSYLYGLSKYLGEDRRAQMQMIQWDYLDYLLSKQERAYVLIEYLTKAGKRYPPCYYTYQKESEGNWSHAGNAEPTPFDSKFFPTLFSFPRLYESTTDNPSHPHLILAGLRIGQILLAYVDLLEGGDRVVLDIMAARELASICEKMFDYPSSIVYLILEEFAEFGLVTLSGGSYPLPVKSDQYRIVVSPKMRFMIDTVIYDIAYLNLAAMRTPVASNVLTLENNTGVYFKAESLDDKRRSLSKESVISDWILSKVINSIGLFRLVRHISNSQKSAYRGKLHSLEGRERIIFEKALQGFGQRNIGLFEVVREMEQGIIDQINAALRVYEQGRGADSLNRLVKRIVHHFAKWDGVTYSIDA